MQSDILIIGAGPAGLSAAKAALRSGRHVTLAGAEPFPPYWRPRLPEIIHTGAQVENIFMQEPEWYKTSGVRFLPSKEAARINPTEKTVDWNDGSSTKYGALILACGSKPNIPPVPFTEKVYPFRTYQDAVEIRQACMKDHKVFIVGGGVLGLETAFAVSQLGISPIVYDISDYPLSRQLDREGGLFLKKKLTEKRIIIRTGADIGNFKDDIEGACVIAAAGVRPAIQLASACGIKTGRGILVDNHMRTSAPDIYACGDIAEFLGALPGLMPVASKQGETAGTNASGGNAVYDIVLPSPMTKVAGISVLSIGSMKSEENARTYRKISEDSYAMAIVFSERITGAAFIGNIAAGMKIKRQMEAGAAIGSVSSYEDIEKACA